MLKDITPYIAPTKTYDQLPCMFCYMAPYWQNRKAFNRDEKQTRGRHPEERVLPEKTRKKLDKGKMIALKNAGWNNQ